MNRSEIAKRLAEWVRSEEHYYVGYALNPGDCTKHPTTGGEDAFFRLVDVVAGLVGTTASVGDTADPPCAECGHRLLVPWNGHVYARCSKGGEHWSERGKRVRLDADDRPYLVPRPSEAKREPVPPMPGREYNCVEHETYTAPCHACKPRPDEAGTPGLADWIAEWFLADSERSNGVTNKPGERIVTPIQLVALLRAYDQRSRPETPKLVEGAKAVNCAYIFTVLSVEGEWTWLRAADGSGFKVKTCTLVPVETGGEG